MIPTTASVGAALQLLADAHVLSAPLVLRTGAAEDSNYMVMGFLSVADFVRVFVERAERAVAFDTPLLMRMRVLSSLGAEFCASGVITLHTSDDGEMVYKGATEALSLLELVRSGLLRMPFRRPPLPPRHRLGVFDEHGRLASIVSMSNVVAWALQHVDELGALPQRTLADLGLAGGGGDDEPARESVVCVPTTMPTHVAFGTAVHRGVSAVGVTDPASGALVANLSQSDFRTLSTHDFGSLALPVGEYLVHRLNLSVPSDDEAAGEHADAASGAAARSVRIRDPWARALHAAHAAVMLGPEATFLRLLEALVGARVHRAYVADENLTPLAVVTHTDVLAVLMRGHKPATR